MKRRAALGKHAAPAATGLDNYRYNELQNKTCLLDPDTIFGPYGIDGELHRHDVRESQKGIDLYLDLGVMDVETCEPLPDAWLSIWACNATGTYSGYTGINPDTVSVLDGWTTRSDGTTDDETFLRGVSKTNEAGMAEFLTIFPGYYESRTTHIHVTVQTNVTEDDTSYSDAAIQHVGQLFFTEDLINSVYQFAPYKSHLSTLNRTLNSEDSVYSVANADGYNAIISTELIGATLAEGLIGYITIGVNKSAEAINTTGESVNVQGYLPTVSLSASAQAAANTKDAAEGYKINGMKV
ncbi:Intradiol ring-cleavage dioxygenase [Aspergillus avenaceus]|uniref:Intradiol ring-cleavage dioxygenase n=1 Tax=Aspergillus avenaceus TaxID=36643 RepID=A0A5N6TZL6_ASPAV|nr:Intradiol ring-cleavage dioxygenase [Aspergillus avenaceus]